MQRRQAGIGWWRILVLELLIEVVVELWILRWFRRLLLLNFRFILDRFGLVSSPTLETMITAAIANSVAP